MKKLILILLLTMSFGWAWPEGYGRLTKSAMTAYVIAQNNTWTGTNTFSGAVTFNALATFTASITADSLLIDTNTLVVDKTNNSVGIGTAAPSAVKLHVVKGAGTVPGLAGDETAIFQNNDDAADVNRVVLLSGASGSNNIEFGTAVARNVGQIQYDPAGSFMNFRVNAGTRMRIISNGNLGIGDNNTSPSAKLSVDGNAGAVDLLELINDTDGAVGDSSFVVNKLGAIATCTSITTAGAITGATLTVTDFTQYISIASSQAGVGGTAPTPTTLETWRGLKFNANTELAFIEFEIPDDWNGTSDMALKIYGFPDAGDQVQNGEVIEFDAEYRSIAEGEPYDNGTSVTISPTYTETASPAADKILIELEAAIDFDNGNQPLTKGDNVGFKILRDVTTSDTYTGDFTVIKFEISYTANSFSKHSN